MERRPSQTAPQDAFESGAAPIPQPLHGWLFAKSACWHLAKSKIRLEFADRGESKSHDM
jgi:hypothetical protein